MKMGQNAPFLLIVGPVVDKNKICAIFNMAQGGMYG